MNKIKTIDMEISVMAFLNYRQNTIVPNVSWGLFIHECDLLILTKSGYLWEVEIKVDKYDLIKDKEKRHKHCNDKLRRLYFAIPDYLEDEISYIPERAGIILVNTKNYRHFKQGMSYKHNCYLLRYPKENTTAKKVGSEEILKIAQLGAMRIHTLKRKISKLDRTLF